MKQLLPYFIATLLLCTFPFAKAAATDIPLESEIVQIGGNPTGMVEHSVYADADTMYRLMAARGWAIRELPQEWNGYHLFAVMLSLRTKENPPAIARPNRLPDRIEMGEEQPFYMWNVPAEPFLPSIGAVHVYYVKNREALFTAKPTDDIFVITITPRDWTPIPPEAPNGMHLAGLNDDQEYEAFDPQNPIQLDENTPPQHLLYKGYIHDHGHGLTAHDLETFLLNLP